MTIVKHCIVLGSACQCVGVSWTSKCRQFR